MKENELFTNLLLVLSQKAIFADILQNNQSNQYFGSIHTKKTLNKKLFPKIGSVEGASDVEMN